MSTAARENRPLAAPTASAVWPVLFLAYIYGFALQEKSMPVETPEQLAEAAKSLRRQFSAGEYPHIAETITEHVTKDYDFADEFEFGLDLILDGLERLRATA